MTETILAAKSLCRSFGSSQVLHNVEFEIPRGTVCSLLGPNGAGKTTLLKLLMGLIEPTTGNCSVLGDGELPRNTAGLRLTGCLIDGFEPPGTTRIRDMLSLSADVSGSFDNSRAQSLLAEKQLSPKTIWQTMSKGQKRWTLLVMLLCRGCEVLLLDEPADGLDPESRQQLYQLIRREVNDRNVTAFITTHIINDIERITDDVCILHHGRMIFQDNLEELRDQVFVVETEQEVEIPFDVQVLRSEITEQSTYWLRDVSGVLSDLTLSGEIRRRKVGLEEIYLAITKEANERLAGQDESSDHSETVEAGDGVGQAPA